MGPSIVNRSRVWRVNVPVFNAVKSIQPTDEHARPTSSQSFMATVVNQVDASEEALRHHPHGRTVAEHSQRASGLIDVVAIVQDEVHVLSGHPSLLPLQDRS